MTRDDAQEMWDTILQQELIYRDRDNMVVQRLACRLYPAPELDQACLLLETHEEDPQGAVREYMATTGFAVPPLTPAQEAALEREAHGHGPAGHVHPRRPGPVAPETRMRIPDNEDTNKMRRSPRMREAAAAEAASLITITQPPGAGNRQSTRKNPVPSSYTPEERKGAGR